MRGAAMAVVFGSILLAGRAAADEFRKSGTWAFPLLTRFFEGRR